MSFFSPEKGDGADFKAPEILPRQTFPTMAGIEGLSRELSWIFQVLIRTWLPQIGDAEANVEMNIDFSNGASAEAAMAADFRIVALIIITSY